jgi:hypothetical protein
MGVWVFLKRVLVQGKTVEFCKLWYLVFNGSIWMDVFALFSTHVIFVLIVVGHLSLRDEEVGL